MPKKILILTGLFLIVAFWFTFFTSQTNATSNIAITSPSGGEKLEKGKTYNIHWDSSNIDQVELRLLWADVSGQVIANVEAELRAYSWTVPETLTPRDDYTIQISQKKTGSYNTTKGEDWNLSNAFSIIESTSIAITSPSGGEKLKKGKTYNISWNSTNIDQVELRLLWADVSGQVIANVNASSSSYSWTVPSTLTPRDDYTIQISQKKTGSYNTTKGEDWNLSNAFSIIETTSIIVTSPSGGEKLKKGKTYNISWNSGDINKVSLRLIWDDDNGNPISGQVIADLSDNPGYYSWTVPLALSPRSSYKIQISEGDSTTSTSVFDVSNAFSIIESTSIAITSPNGEEIVKPNQLLTVEWSSVNLPSTVSISANVINIDTEDSIALFSLAPNNGSYSVNLNPSVFAPGKYKVEIFCDDHFGGASCGEISVNDQSDNYFTIIPSTTCTDSDSGKDYFKKGVINHYRGILNDYCVNSSTLLEGYCLSSADSQGNIHSSKTYICPNGCQNGACLKDDSVIDKDQDIVEIEDNANLLHQNKLDKILVELKELRNIVEEQKTKIKYLEDLKKDVQKLSETVEDAINNFIAYGVDDNTKKLGAGERAAVIYSFKSTFKKLPETEDELADAIKIANGRWPRLRSDEAEKQAKEQFQKIYKRIADMNDPEDNAAITVMAYGLRQKAENRNLNSEKQGIKTFKNIYGYTPSTTEDWNIMQAITYSGATRGVDTDGDLLTDTRENELGTDLNNKDTDSDGYLDGIEVANGYDPLTAIEDAN